MKSGDRLFCSVETDAPSVKMQERPGGTEHVYKKVDGQEMKLWVVTPPGWSKADKRPAIIFFHGGGWVGGPLNQFGRQGNYLASRGMVSIQVRYRFLGEKGPSTLCIEDARSALRWVRSHAAELGIDPQRMVGSGGSAGGHLAAACALLTGIDDTGDDLAVSPKPHALVLFNPVIDNGPDGYGFERVGDQYPKYSPAHNITPQAPPTLVMIGTMDTIVPTATVTRFKATMDKNNVRCDVIYYEGQGHGFFNGTVDSQYFYQTLLETDKFLTSLGYLKGPSTLPIPADQPSSF